MSSPLPGSPADTPSEQTAPTDRVPPGSAYLISAVACTLLVAIPFFVVTLPPITDLPQQTAQVRLLLDTVGNDESPYRVQWLNPNKLGYAPLLVAWLTQPPIAAGRIGMLWIALLWVVALHALAHATQRSPAAAALASIFFFNHLTYWGLLNCLIGLPIFAAWFVTLDRMPARTPSLRHGLKLLALAILLYSAHVLWLAVALAWLAVSALAARLPLRHLVLRLAWVSPVLGAALVWYPHLRQSGFVSETVWGRSPWGRLHPEWFLNSALGGLEGQLEPILGSAVLAWLLLGLAPKISSWVLALLGHKPTATDPGSAGDNGHPRLALAGLFFLLLALCLPGVIQSTIFFASRWFPVAIVLLVLACPQPRLRPWLRLTVPYVLLASLTVATASIWIDFENRELDGLHESLAAVPPDQRVLGLDFVRTSERIKGYPFYHFYAYSQVLHGGELARSFANFGSSLVVFSDMPRKFPWTEGLDWRARKIRKSDMEHFQYVIIFGNPEAHALFRADGRLTPVTGDRPWRLYRVGP